MSQLWDSFVWTAGEQQFFAEKGFHPPRKCRTCRGSSSSRVPTDRSDMFSITCESCRRDAWIRQMPRPGRPGLCGPCFRDRPRYHYQCMECSTRFSLDIPLDESGWTLCGRCKAEQRDRNAMRRMGMSGSFGTSSRYTTLPGLGRVRKDPNGGRIPKGNYRPFPR